MYSELSNAYSNVRLSQKLTEIRAFKVMFRNVGGVYFLTTLVYITIYTVYLHLGLFLGLLGALLGLHWGSLGLSWASLWIS